MRHPSPQSGVALLDSITEIQPKDRGGIVVAGSHGGASATAYALAHPPLAAFFNDAGGGKDAAGLSGLEPLAQAGIIAIAYSHQSARIGEALDGWRNGIVTACNSLGAAQGISAGMSVRDAAAKLLSGRR